MAQFLVNSILTETIKSNKEKKLQKRRERRDGGEVREERDT